ncbi:MAG: head GIN domain-containing protein [Bacteroidota bacterium]
MKLRAIITFLAVSFFITSCTFWGVRGNGQLKTESRNIAEFTKLDASGSYSIKIKVGESPSLRIKAEENLLSLIRTRVKGNTLVIDNKKNLSPRKELLIEITTKDLTAIDCSGANDIEVVGISADKFELNLSGAGSIELEGKVDNFHGNLSGAGSISASSLIANKVYISVSGAASANVYAKEFLDAQVSGVGSINFYGNPQNTRTNVSGVGSISRK